jgi:4Fe-4S ferredoxin
VSKALEIRYGENTVSLERRYLTKLVKLELSNEKCLGCGTCTEVCPKEALTLSNAIHKDGSLVLLPRVKMDPEKCVLCGTCVVFCPSHALKLTKDGEEEVSVIEYQIMPELVRSITVEAERCKIDCGLKCEEVCPKECITVTEVDGEITGVFVDEDLCIFCRQCEVACPYGLITTQSPYEGIVEIDTEKCPEGCAVCRDACPSHAITMNMEMLPEVDPEFCILCSACEKVCPEDAVEVTRASVKYSDVKSGAWFKVLERLTSPEVKAIEIEKDAARNRRKVVSEANTSLGWT